MARARWEAHCPTCGETYTRYRDGFGRRRDADAWEERHEGEEWECPGCYAETRKRLLAEGNRSDAEKAAAMAERVGKALRPLAGTEKQVPWAEGIRARAFREAVVLNPSARRELVDVLNLEGEARFWIDGRDEGGMGLLAGIRKRHGAEADALAAAAEAGKDLPDMEPSGGKEKDRHDSRERNEGGMDREGGLRGAEGGAD